MTMVVFGVNFYGRFLGEIYPWIISLKSDRLRIFPTNCPKFPMKTTILLMVVNPPTLLTCSNFAIKISLDNKQSMVINSYVAYSTKHLVSTCILVELNCGALNVAEMSPCLADSLGFFGTGDRARALVLGEAGRFRKRSISTSLRYISLRNNQMW